MNQKVILISIDGMRPDGLLQCGNPFVETLLKEGSYCLTGKAVYPSVTLPCHMSMFHSVPPERHGITTNLYTPQVRPVSGLLEQIRSAAIPETGLLDIAPTVATLMGVPIPREWEGKSLVSAQMLL